MARIRVVVFHPLQSMLTQEGKLFKKGIHPYLKSLLEKIVMARMGVMELIKQHKQKGVFQKLLLLKQSIANTSPATLVLTTPVATATKQGVPTGDAAHVGGLATGISN